MTCRDQIYSEDYYNFIIRNSLYIQGFLPGECHVPLDSLYHIEFYNKSMIPPMGVGNYNYATIPKLYAPLGEEALEATGILDVRNLPNLALQGEGILMGFIDTGINYMLPAFFDETGATRIVSIWDQSIQNADAPENLGYGAEYGREELNRALASEDPLTVVPSMDENGHGSYVASVAAGSITANGLYSGGAPKADLAVVKLKGAKQYLRDYFFVDREVTVFQEDDIMMAVRYLDELAAKRDQPLVICLALGASVGSHSGNSPLSAYLDSVAVRFRRCVVTAAGNEAANRHHFYGRFPVVSQEERQGKMGSSPGEYVEVELMVGEGVPGFTMEQWALAPLLYEVSIISPTGETVPRIPAQQGKNQQLDFLFENTRVDLDYSTPEGATGNQLIFFRFTNPAAGLWRIRVFLRQQESGTFQMYLPMEEILAGEVYFLRSNPDTTITAPGNAVRVITVGGYDDATGALYLSSGRGYTLEGNIKPDFVAPAVNVTGVNTFGNGRLAATRPVYEQYSVRTGTSAAAAFASAASALYMEWAILQQKDPTVSTTQVRNFLVRGTKKSPDELYPNRQWGNGIMDLYRAFLNLRR